MFDKKEYDKEYRRKNKERIAEYKLKNKESLNSYAKEYYLKNKEKIKANAKEYCKNNSNGRRNSRFKREYNFTLEEYILLHNKQEGVCAICGLPESALDNTSQQVKFLAIDHCHTTGDIRGLLCTLCNTAIGKFKDNPIIIRKAASYLENYINARTNTNKILTDTTKV